MTLHEQIERKCLKIGVLHKYLIWRGVKIDRGDLTHKLKGNRPIPRKQIGLRDLIEGWIEHPYDPKFEETKN